VITCRATVYATEPGGESDATEPISPLISPAWHAAKQDLHVGEIEQQIARPRQCAFAATNQASHASFASTHASTVVPTSDLTAVLQTGRALSAPLAHTQSQRISLGKCGLTWMIVPARGASGARRARSVTPSTRGHFQMNIRHPCKGSRCCVSLNANECVCNLVGMTS
jgi:hypothetical protein